MTATAVEEGPPSPKRGLPMISNYIKPTKRQQKKALSRTCRSGNFRCWFRVMNATMRITHKPGDTMQVDWGGDPLYITDDITGERWLAFLRYYCRAVGTPAQKAAMT